jgi:hypothetical protein
VVDKRSVDPDVTYTKLSEAFAAWSSNQGTHGELVGLFGEAAEHWRALDEWLKQGGFAPAVWDPAKLGWQLREMNPTHWEIRHNAKFVCSVRFDGSGGYFGAHWQIVNHPTMLGDRFHSPGEAFSRVRDAYEGRS